MVANLFRLKVTVADSDEGNIHLIHADLEDLSPHLPTVLMEVAKVMKPSDRFSATFFESLTSYDLVCEEVDEHRLIEDGPLECLSVEQDFVPVDPGGPFKVMGKKAFANDPEELAQDETLEAAAESLQRIINTHVKEGRRVAYQTGARVWGVFAGTSCHSLLWIENRSLEKVSPKCRIEEKGTLR